MPIGEYHSTPEAATKLGVTRWRILQLMKLARVKGTKFGRDWFFTAAEIKRMQAKQRPRGRPRKKAAKQVTGRRKSRAQA